MKTFDEYQKEAAEFRKYDPEDALYYVTLGLCGEAGELANKVKKVIRDDGGYVTMQKRAALAGELGDLLWYLAAVTTELGLHLENIATQNIFKLRDRNSRGVIGGEGDER